MEIIRNYILQNWILVLVLAAFVIALAITAFLDKKVKRRTYIMIAAVFVLSICVSVEFSISSNSDLITLRTVLMAIRYSATPFIIAHLIFTLVKRQRLYVFLPAFVLLVIDIVSIFTGIVFTIDASNNLVRGPLGYLPFIVAGFYCAWMIFMLAWRSNKRALELIPIIFLAFALVSGLVFPFVLGPDFAQLFCPTIAVALFIYYVFSILQLTKKDALTGLLNRQAYYAETGIAIKDITAIISIDMNGLKKINDTQGHDAGDEALVTIALCFGRACRVRQSAYRMGGDEFVIVCRKTSEEDVVKLIERIQKYVANTKYTCSIGYSFSKDGFTAVEEMLKKSDEQMYSKKKEFYQNKNPAE